MFETAVGERIRSTAWGPKFDDDIVASTLDRCGIAYEPLGNEVAEVTAAHLAAGEVVGWFQGPTEGGPRALGGRSILADPRSVDLRDHVNRDVKRRETWRPFAPSMLSSEAERFVDRPWDADFMIVAYLASEQARTEVPGVVHVDGTMRPQFVDDDADTPYARVLGVFKEHTGAGGLLNTSFNNEAEPIVSSPLDAIRTFFSTPLDVLAIGGCLVRK